MTIFITGGAGFIGSNFVIHLLKQGVDVVNVDKLTYAGNLSNLGSYTNHPKHHFYKDDICDESRLKQIIKTHQPAAIIHMAAESHVDRSIDCANAFIQTNIVGTQCVLNVALAYFRTLPQAKKKSFRFLHLSTDEVFGTLQQTGKFTEDSPYQPNSPYAASKAAADFLVRAYYKTHQLPTITINASNNYGPHQYPEKLIPLMILNALAGNPLPVYGNGQQIRDWLYVQDHVQALYLLLNAGNIGECYCVGSNNEYDNLSLIKTICAILDDIKPKSQGHYEDLITFVPDRPGHDFRYATDSSKLMKHTGWHPVIDFKKGLRETIQWYLVHYKTLSNINHTKRFGLGETA